jgi:rubrerythrin
LEAALAAEQQALRAHVEGIGLLGEREFRALFADLVAEAAQHESALLTLLDRPAAPTAFPGQPT